MKAFKNTFKVAPLVLVLILLTACADKETPAVTESESTPNQNIEMIPESENAEPAEAAWETYTDSTYNYSFQYPSDWTIIEPNPESEVYGLLLSEGMPENPTDFKNNIDITRNIYAVDEVVRNDFLKTYQGSDYEKMSITGGEAYYFVCKNPDGEAPCAALVSDKEIFLVTFNVETNEIFTFAEAEKWFKEFLTKVSFS